MVPSPVCTINGLPAPQDVAAGSTVTIALENTAGANLWLLQCTSTDELNSIPAINATLVINETAKTATFTAPTVLGSAVILTSVVGIDNIVGFSGLDANANVNPEFTTTLKVNVLAGNGQRVLATSEIWEQDAIHGWIAVINRMARGVGIPSSISITGTGIPHWVGGNPAATATPINLSSNGAGGDVTNVLAFINGGRLQGDINVTHAAPGTFDATHQIAYCDTSTGTCSVTFPPASAFPGSVIPADWQVLVVDTGGAAATSAITVNPNGESVWNPTTGAFVTSNIVLGGKPTTNGVAALWQWDANKSHWVLVNASSSGSAFGSIGNGGAVVTGTYTLASTDFNTLIAAGSQVTGPATPIVGATYRLTSASGTFETSPASFIGNSYNVYNPNPSAAYANGASVLLKTSGIAYEWWWDGTAMRLAA